MLISTDRLYSPPASMDPVILITDNSGVEKVEVPADDQFGRSLDHFAKCMEDPAISEKRRKQILKQAGLVQSIIEKSKDN